MGHLPSSPSSLLLLAGSLCSSSCCGRKLLLAVRVVYRRAVRSKQPKDNRVIRAAQYGDLNCTNIITPSRRLESRCENYGAVRGWYIIVTLAFLTSTLPK